MTYLHWRRMDRWYIQADTGHKVCAGGVGNGKFRFTATTPGKKSLGCFDKSEDAKDACQRHHDNS